VRTGCRAVYGSLRLSGATPGTGPGAAGAERLGRRSGASTPSQRPRLGRSIVARRQAHRLWTAAAISAGGSGAEEADWAGELRARRSRKKPAARPSPGREYERRGSDRVAAPPEGRRAAPNRRRASAAGSSSQSSSLPPNLHFMPALFSCAQDTSASVSGLRRPAVRGRSSPKFSPTNRQLEARLPPPRLLSVCWHRESGMRTRKQSVAMGQSAETPDTSGECSPTRRSLLDVDVDVPAPCFPSLARLTPPPPTSPPPSQPNAARRGPKTSSRPPRTMRGPCSRPR